MFTAQQATFLGSEVGWTAMSAQWESIVSKVKRLMDDIVVPSILPIGYFSFTAMVLLYHNSNSMFAVYSQGTLASLS